MYWDSILKFSVLRIEIMLFIIVFKYFQICCFLCYVPYHFRLHLADQEESRKAKNPIREVPTEVNPGEQNDTIDGDQIKQLKRNK